MIPSHPAASHNMAATPDQSRTLCCLLQEVFAIIGGSAYDGTEVNVVSEYLLWNVYYLGLSLNPTQE